MFNVEELNKIDTERLKRPDLASQLRFDDINDSIVSLKNLFLELQQEDTSVLTDNKKKILHELYQKFKATIDSISAFKQEKNEDLRSASKRRGELKNELLRLELEIYSIALPLKVVILDKKKNDRYEVLEKQLSEFEERINASTAKIQESENQINQFLNTQKENLKQKQKEVNDIVSSTKQDAEELKRLAQAEVANKTAKGYAEIFKNQACKNRNIAIGSLLVFIGISFVFILLTLILFAPVINVLTTPESTIGVDYIITNIIFKLTILSVFVLFIKESLKSFNINMHLWNLNNHRKNALESFDAFIATIDKETQSYLIEQIAKTIYSVNKIGYLSSDDKKGFSIDQATDLAKIFKS